MKLMINRIEKRVEKLLENIDSLDKRAYLTVTGEGDILRKKMNLAVPCMVYCESDELFQTQLEKEIDFKERQKDKDISRLSNVDLIKAVDIFTKVVIKGELEFAKKYGKELALRDKELFYKTLFNLSLMDNIKFKKPLMALAFKEIMEVVGWNDKIGYLVISYFTKQRYDLNEFENAKEYIEEEFKVEESLDLVAYKKVLESYEYKNSKKYRYILKKENEKLEKKEMLNIEQEILKTI